MAAMRCLRLVTLVAAAMMVWGQAAEFEVASVKPSGPKSDRDSSGGPGTADPGRYSFHSATLLDLIATAYHVDYFQISGKTLEEQRYDLDAKLPPHTTREEFRAMLRNLLDERFRPQGAYRAAAVPRLRVDPGQNRVEVEAVGREPSAAAG